METAASAIRFWSQNLAQGSFSRKNQRQKRRTKPAPERSRRDCPPCLQGQNPHPQLTPKSFCGLRETRYILSHEAEIPAICCRWSWAISVHHVVCVPLGTQPAPARRHHF